MFPERDVVCARVHETCDFIQLHGSWRTQLFIFVCVLPGVTFSEARPAAGVAPMPREMAFPVPKDQEWHNLYDYIRYGCSLLGSNPPRLPELPSP